MIIPTLINQKRSAAPKERARGTSHMPLACNRLGSQQQHTPVRLAMSAGHEHRCSVHSGAAAAVSVSSNLMLMRLIGLHFIDMLGVWPCLAHHITAVAAVPPWLCATAAAVSYTFPAAVLLQCTCLCVQRGYNSCCAFSPVAALMSLLQGHLQPLRSPTCLPTFAAPTPLQGLLALAGSCAMASSGCLPHVCPRCHAVGSLCRAHPGAHPALF